MPCRRKKSTETQYKEVVVVGNGPSAISLSYMLAGNVAFYDGTSSDEMLHARLCQQRDQPLVLQDLQLLSDGLEGRSTNPVSVLFDALSHPDADTGFEQPSLLMWKNRPDLSVDHVVLGKGKPGGAWTKMSESNMLTVSFGAWMEMPNLKMSEWKTSLADHAETRVTVATVAQYYQDYVRLMGLTSNFENNVEVTSIRKITEFSADDCLSMTSSLSRAMTPTTFDDRIRINQTSLPDVMTSSAEENAIFEHESSLYAEDIFQLPSPRRLSSDFISCRSSNSDNENNIVTVMTSWENESAYSSSSPVTSSSGPEMCPPELQEFEMAAYSPPPAPMTSSLSAITEGIEMRRRALSGTRLGKFMQHQAQRCANISCCLEVAKCDGQEDGVIYNLSWNPIVNPRVFCCSQEGPIFESRSAPKSSGRSYSWCNVASSSCRSNNNTGSRRGSVTCPVSKCFPQVPHLWEVSGVRVRINPESGESETEEFRYLTKNVVLATGSYDRPNSLSVSGEQLPFVFHSLREFESFLAGKESSQPSDLPVMIVGAGLSAADAIIAALQQQQHVVHVFRRDATDRTIIFNNLPGSLYPEYHRVHRMMMSKEVDDRYRPMEKNHIVKILEDGQVKLHGELSCCVLKVSCVVVLVGSSPNLDFLDDLTTGDQGRGLGILPGQPISRNNPVDIDVFTHESIHQRGLYAMGPLVGDNFVRFLQGGALAIVANILKTKKKVDQEPIR